MTRIDACTRPVSVCRIERGIVAEEMGRPLDRLYFENETVVARLLSGLETERGVAGRVPNRGLTTRDWQRFCSANSRQQILDSRHHTTSPLPASAPFSSPPSHLPHPRSPRASGHAPHAPHDVERWCVIDFLCRRGGASNSCVCVGSNPLYTGYV